MQGMADRLRRSFQKQKKGLCALKKAHPTSKVEALLLVKYVDQGSKETRFTMVGDSDLLELADNFTTINNSSSTSSDGVEDRLFDLKNVDKDFKVDDIRKVMTQCVKTSTNRNRPLWRKNDKKPVWWPSGVIWGLKAEVIDGEKLPGPSKHDLIAGIVACYKHHDAMDLLSDYLKDQLSTATAAVPQHVLDTGNVSTDDGVTGEDNQGNQVALGNASGQQETPVEDPPTNQVQTLENNQAERNQVTPPDEEVQDMPTTSSQVQFCGVAGEGNQVVLAGRSDGQKTTVEDTPTKVQTVGTVYRIYKRSRVDKQPTQTMKKRCVVTTVNREDAAALGFQNVMNSTYDVNDGVMNSTFDKTYASCNGDGDPIKMACELSGILDTLVVNISGVEPLSTSSTSSVNL